MTYGGVQFDALGDGTRRAILARLLNGPLAVGELARDLPVSRPAISQHLRILKEADLVLHQSVGARHVYRLNPAGFETLRQYLDVYWAQALEAFANEVERRARQELQ